MSFGTDYLHRLFKPPASRPGGGIGASSERPEETLDQRYEATYGVVSRIQSQHVDNKLLKQLRITCASLDFDTGGAGEQKTNYISPFRPEAIQKFLKLTNPWADYSNQKSPFLPRRSKPSSPWIEACTFLGIVRHFLESSEDGREGIIYIYSNWSMAESPDSYDLHGVSNHLLSWTLEGAYRQYLDPKIDKLDTGSPHTMAFVASEGPLVDSQLLTGELACALYLVFESCRDGNYANHRFFPSTVISGSARHVRIIQCVLDSKTLDIEIRKSRIVNFDDGILAEQNKPEFFTLLGWAMAFPVTCTQGEVAAGPEDKITELRI